LRIEHFRDWESIGLGQAGWNRLVERCRQPVPFATWQFQTTWHRTFTDGRLHLLAAQDGAGEWVGLLPLYPVSAPDGPRLRLVGGVEVADYLDLIALAGREEEVWKALLPSLAELPARALELRPIPAASPTTGMIASLAPAAGLASRVEVDERCPVIALPNSWDAYLASLPGKDRHELRRKLRRTEAGRPRIETGRTPGEVARLMDGFLALHRKSKVGKARFMDGRMEGFFREAVGALAAAGIAVVWTLSLEERPAASLVCFEYGGSVALYNSGFDPEARAMSPGVALIARTIQDAIARGFRTYDFLRGEEPYKYGFGARAADVLRVTVERP
jgi:CelD/BcsL family acetyltransferase involved in cellulose biosynthesis